MQLTHVQGERMSSTTLYQALVVACLAVGLRAHPAGATPLSVGVDLRDDGDIGGSVVDSATGTPLPGGEVRIERGGNVVRSEEHTSELQSHVNLVCRLLLEKEKKKLK